MVSTTQDITFKLIGTTELSVWGPMYLTLTGTPDFDEFVFNQIEKGHLTPGQTSYLWEYTDGYKFTITSTVGDVNSSNGKYSAHCLKKTRSAILDGSYNSGAICF